ncbi:MAG: hypothetical protein LBB09_01105 [Rickettsiales bacterium]|jgi:type IV secretion system protein VirB10|nr:hypothetical protein [Rickettsiales bacterium]
MTDRPFDPIVPVEGEPAEAASPAKSGLAIAGSGGGKITIIVVALASSLLIYFFMFSGGSQEDVVDNRDIVATGKTSSVSYKDLNSIENLGNLIAIDYNDRDADNVANEQLLELPTLPALPENIVSNIEEEIKETQKQKNITAGEVFTKKEVDDLISEKLKSFEEEMRKVQNESERLAKEIQRQKLLEEEENKKVKKSIIPSILSTPGGEPPSPFGSPSPASSASLDPTSPEGVFAAEEARRAEEEKKELQRAQRARVMEERRSATMFKMQGGGGGDSSSVDQNSIVITNKDSLQTIADTTSSAQPTKLPDLSRTLVQGKIISAVLETAINTDVNSQIRAIVSRDIYSETNKNVLIPKGSKLIGTFQANGLNSGVSRITISWTRLIRVDGLNLTLSANTADDLGRGGIDGELDNKYSQTVKNALLSSVVTIASSLLVEKITGSVGITNATTSGLDGSSVIQTSGKVSDYAIVEATQNFADEMQNLVDSIKEQTPTIRVAQGTKLNVVVNQDLALPIYKQKK